MQAKNLLRILKKWKQPKSNTKDSHQITGGEKKEDKKNDLQKQTQNN